DGGYGLRQRHLPFDRRAYRRHGNEWYRRMMAERSRGERDGGRCGMVTLMPSRVAGLLRTNLHRRRPPPFPVSWSFPLPLSVPFSFPIPVSFPFLFPLSVSLPFPIPVSISFPVPFSTSFSTPVPAPSSLPVSFSV